jgi:hypothetical protein
MWFVMVDVCFSVISYVSLRYLGQLMEISVNGLRLTVQNL